MKCATEKQSKTQKIKKEGRTKNRSRIGTPLYSGVYRGDHLGHSEMSGTMKNCVTSKAFFYKITLVLRLDNVKNKAPSKSLQVF